MSPVTHFLTGWVLGSAAGLNRRGRAVVTVAAVIPDVDGLGVIVELLTRHSQNPLLWFSEFHHHLHTLFFALIVSVCAFLISENSWVGAVFAFASFHLHLLEDLVGSRGPDGFGWPIPYLLPFSSRWSWTWQGQWQLNAWPNVVLTVGLILVTLWIAVSRGFSPMELFSRSADQTVVSALRKRFQTTGA